MISRILESPLTAFIIALCIAEVVTRRKTRVIVTVLLCCFVWAFLTAAGLESAIHQHFQTSRIHLITIDRTTITLYWVILAINFVIVFTIPAILLWLFVRKFITWGLDPKSVAEGERQEALRAHQEQAEAPPPPQPRPVQPAPVYEQPKPVYEPPRSATNDMRSRFRESLFKDDTPTPARRPQTPRGDPQSPPPPSPPQRGRGTLKSSTTYEF